jgi:hypothetical protein
MQTRDAVVLRPDAAYSGWRDAGGEGSECRRPDKIERSSGLMKARTGQVRIGRRTYMYAEHGRAGTGRLLELSEGQRGRETGSNVCDTGAKRWTSRQP